MANEKLKILKMLEEGKISAQEAARLLESMSGTADYTGGATRAAYTHMPKTEQYTNNSNNNSGRRDAGDRRVSEDFENFTNDLGRKFDTFVRDMEPKIQKFTDVVVEKTASTADKLSKTLYSHTPPPSSPSPRPAPAPAPQAGGRGTDKSIELKVSGGNNQLSLTSRNGAVLLKGYNGDNIAAKISYRAKNPGVAQPELMVLGTKYFLNYDEEQFDFVSIDAFIPEFLFDSVNIASINGDLTVSGVKADFIDLRSKNGNMDVRNIDAKNIRIENGNGNIKLAHVVADNAQIECYSGSISADHIDVSQLKMNGLNGEIMMNIAGYARFNDYLWSIEANNARMILNLPAMPGLAYHIKAGAALSNVNIGLPGLNMLTNTGSYVEAKSFNYEESGKKVKMILETTNAMLTVN